MSINAMERVNENERFVVKNGIKLLYICVTMIGQVVLSCLNRNSHIFILIDRSIYEKNQKYLVRISKYSASCLHPNMEF
jgi:hypothetical protein